MFILSFLTSKIGGYLMVTLLIVSSLGFAYHFAYKSGYNEATQEQLIAQAKAVKKAEDIQQGKLAKEHEEAVKSQTKSLEIENKYNERVAVLESIIKRNPNLSKKIINDKDFKDFQASLKNEK